MVGTDVQRLLQRLAADHDDAQGRAFLVRCQDHLDRTIQDVAILGGKAGMVKRGTACHLQQQIGPARRDNGIKGRAGGRHGVADDKHAGAPARRRHGKPGRLGRVHRGMSRHRDGLGPAVGGFGFGRASAARPQRGVGRGDRTVESRQGKLQKPAARPAAQRGGHQHRVAPCGQVTIQQFRQDFGHVGVRAVNLVHHQQAAAQGRAAQMGVLDLQAGQQRLIDGAHGDRRRQVAGGMFRRPAGGLRSLGVVPPGLETGQALACRLARQKLAGDRKNRLGRIVAEQPLHGLVDAAVQLPGRGPRRNGEIETRHQPRRVQQGKAPQGGLGLARTGFRFKQHQGTVQVGLAHQPLRRARCKAPSGHAAEVGCRPCCAKIKANDAKGVPRGPARPCRVIGPGIRDEIEESAVRPDPVGQSRQSCDQVNKGGRFRQERSVLQGRPGHCPDPQVVGDGTLAVIACDIVGCAECRGRFDRAAMMGKDRHHQFLRALAP